MLTHFEIKVKRLDSILSKFCIPYTVYFDSVEEIQLMKNTKAKKYMALREGMYLGFSYDLFRCTMSNVKFLMVYGRADDNWLTLKFKSKEDKFKFLLAF